MAEKVFQGIGVSPGVARGRIYVYRIAEEVVPQYELAAKEVPDEINRFEQALIKTREQLHKLQEGIASGIGSSAPSSILDVHLSITEDPALIEPVIHRIEKEHKNAEFIFNDVGRK
jgi:phosphoenolpyruvate-protein phosphotransferase (PTS system enzyme I)